MTTVLFSAFGLPGHCFPLVPLAQAFAARGDGVRFVTPGSMHAQLAGSGLSLLAGGVEAEAAMAAGRALPRTPQAPRFQRTFVEVGARAFAADVDAILTDVPADLVISEVWCPGPLLAAARHGVPALVHGLGLRPAGAEHPQTAIDSAFDALCAETGLGPGDSLAAGYLDVCPPSLGPRERAGTLPRLSLSPVAWTTPGAPRPPRPQPDRPWVYVTLGTVVQGRETIATVLAGLADLDVDVLVAAGASDLDGLAADTRVSVVPWVDQADVLARCDLVIHHGGSGTMFAAAARGVPQLMLGWRADQAVNGAALSAVGAGRALDLRALTAVQIATASDELLAGAAARGVGRLSREIAAMPPPDAVAAQLTDWVEAGRMRSRRS